jgi:hypothetical protein
MGNLTPHRGGMILAFGILGLIVCLPFGIAAWVMGNTDLRAMDAGTMDPSGQGLTQAGKILGIVTVVMYVVGIVCWMLFMLLFAGVAVVSEM